MSRPTGQAMRNWKKGEKRRLLREGLPIPTDWVAHWESVHGVVQSVNRGQKPSGFTVQEIPSPEFTALELIEMRKEKFRRKKAFEEATKLIHVQVHDEGPIGILHLGDPHVDDDGCDWVTLQRHMEVVANTPGLYAANIGDTTNNWIGRLARLYGQQSTTARDGWILAEYLINFIGKKWLYLVSGNHDAWSGDADPISWICRQNGALHQEHGARLGLEFPNGAVITIQARHNHPGSSMWNSAHAQTRQAKLGIRDDVIISGHKHISGEAIVKCPETSKVCHCIQVASYKAIDRYSKEAGFQDQAVSPCVLTILDPSLPVGHPNRVTHFWDAELGAEVLTLLRERREAA